ncbi:MAG: ATP-grasp domain-containing protein [Burkholderiales bacterium]|nr:ATP-grasp domain-containing protein [Burkholderiales bacterium]
MTPQRAQPAGTPPSPTIVVAGLSVRGLAESARCAGWHVLALDAFGDLDTRRASAGWWSIAEHSGDGGAPRIDPARLLGALHAAALSRPAGSELLGWVAGSGFEAQPELLDPASRLVPLLGMGADAIAAVRQPRSFFETLAGLGIDYPEVAFESPRGAGWLAKDMACSGGQGVRRWPGAQVGADTRSSVYWQREASGRSIGCLLLAQGRGFELLGVHDQLVDPSHDEPFRFAGVVGPSRLSDMQMATLLATLQRLVPAFGLRGLISVDWLLAGDRWLALEVNPRPSASLAMHERRLAHTTPRSLLTEHVAQFLSDDLRSQLGLRDARHSDGTVIGRPPPAGHCCGELIVYARTPLTLDPATLARWTDKTDRHDIPSAPIDLPAGAPVLSVSAAGPDTSTVMLALEQRRADVLRELMPRHLAPSDRSPTPYRHDAQATETIPS